MKKIFQIILVTALVISSGFGIWHFFVPYIYHWYDYLPGAPMNIISSIDWINFLFSLFLTGNSIILLVFYKRIFLVENLALVEYGFLVFVWFARVIITIIFPFNGVFDWIFWIQISIFGLVFILHLIPFILLLSDVKKKNTNINTSIT